MRLNQELLTLALKINLQCKHPAANTVVTLIPYTPNIQFVRCMICRRSWKVMI